jgi:glycine hydroxymethyltransferase
MEAMSMQDMALTELMRRGDSYLNAEDPILFDLLHREAQRQADVLVMVASMSIADPSVLVCQGMPTTNVSTEGYPGARFHAGCEIVDEIERLAIERAKTAFGAQYANVQPHSGTTANQIVMFSLLEPGDSILGLELRSGGHLSHGATASTSGQYFNAVHYGLDRDGFIDYEQVLTLAKQHNPKLIICGASAYPREIDFGRFRRIADEVGAYLLADISHIAGLVVAGEHPSPVDHAHFTTTSTYKQLFGPRGGLILMGRDHDTPGPDGRRTLSQLMQRAVFPYFQGTPNLSGVAAKARALAMVMEPGFKILARQIMANARVIAQHLFEEGYPVITGGTDNHMILFNVLSGRSGDGISGVIAERALEECHIVVNKNNIPGDVKPPRVTSGVRLGSNTISSRGFALAEAQQCAKLICNVLSKASDDFQYELDSGVRDTVRSQVADLCTRFPIPRYGV